MPGTHSLLLHDLCQFRHLSNWDIDLKQIEAGDATAKVSLWAGRNLSVMDLSFDRPVHQMGTSRQGFLSIGLPEPGSIRSWLGRRSLEAPIMTFGTDEPFEGISANTFKGLVFSFPIQRAIGIANDCGLDVDQILRCATKSSVSRKRSKCANLRQGAGQFTSRTDGPRTEFDEDDLILSLLETLSAVPHWADRGSAAPRSRYTQRAVDYMFARLDENLSVRDICAEIGVSAPTLRRGFLESYGVGPKQFYLRAKLNRVRSDLSNSSIDRRIVDIANDYGFWHMGQFAKDYRTLFGELPSQTRR